MTHKKSIKNFLFPRKLKIIKKKTHVINFSRKVKYIFIILFITKFDIYANVKSKVFLSLLVVFQKLLKMYYVNFHEMGKLK